MATVTAATLKALAPAINDARAADYAPALDQAMAAKDINTPLRIAHFLAQLAHESAGFKALVENLNYKPETLVKVFPKRVGTLANAQKLVAAGPSAIAEAIYGNRADLGNVNPGDGYKYRGRGFIMITGRSNYTSYAKLISQPLVDQPELLEQAVVAAQASAAFWASNSLNTKADADDIVAITKVVNGGTNGLDDRKTWLAKAKTVWPAVIAAAPVAGAVAGAVAAAATTAAGAISRYFTLSEMTFSSTATRLGIDNTPSAGIVSALTDTAQHMDAIRILLGNPIHVDSGYRSPALNNAVKGASNSAHLTGRAVDFVCPEFGTPLQICAAIVKAGIKFDQLIQEGTWVHISFDPAMRQQVLTAKYVNGRTQYTQGL
ncbi:MAG TPA: D-Ala-D-Ala carboxypeptidase family metallohydrolase [Asticcacaulis sp.]|nr:D-Ala-D-Ala carboxypeptidase family metallohydrolase [Asticcacaulis sp.]